MEVIESIYANSIDPLVIVTKLIFKKNGTEIGYASLYGYDLYCNVEFLPVAVEWLVNNHMAWHWTTNGTR
jgi:hypothetical protein